MPHKDPVKRAEYRKQHGEKHKERYLARQRKQNAKYRREIAEFVQGYKKAHECVDCGNHDHRVLEFDHRDRSEKLFNVSEAAKGRYSLDTVKKEIEKCDVRCANCHRIKTWVENVMADV